MRYYILFITIVVIIIYSIFKWKYGFWMSQPVYHLYDVSYYLAKPRVIKKDLPDKNRYVNIVNVKTKFTSTFSEQDWTGLVVFLQKYFIREKHNVYNPKMDNVVPFFKDSKSMCSFYYETVQYKNETDGSIIVNDRHISAVMTSRPIFCILYKTHIPVYYVDYLCVATNKRKSGLAPTIIQTHHYNQRRMNPGIQISLFRRDQEMTWIIPLTYYDTHVYDVKEYSMDIRIHAKYQLVHATAGIIDRVMEFISNHTYKYDACLYDCYEAIKCQIDTNNMFVYALINKSEPDGMVAVYILKNPKVTVMHYTVTTLIGSIQGSVTDEVFYYVFLKIIQKLPGDNRLIAIENTSDNNRILQKMNKSKPVLISPTAYFLYNYICQPIASNKCLILV